MNPFGKFEIVDCGGFPVPKYGSLLQAEAEWLEGRKMAELEAVKKVLELAKTIALAENIEGSEALALLQSMGSEEARSNSILVNYADRLDCLFELQTIQKGISIGSATLMLQRVPFEWIESHEEDLWQAFKLALPESRIWSIDCTKRLPVQIINQLDNLFDNEFNQWVPAKLEMEQTLGEALPSVSDSSPPPELTGKGSTTRSRGRAIVTHALTGETSGAAL